MELNNYQTEITKALETLKGVGKCVAVIGSSYISPDTKAYADAGKTGYELAKAGYAVMTGGGFGLMEAVNKGAQKAGGKSIGVFVKYKNNYPQNDFVDKEYNIVLSSISARKELFQKMATAFVALPGGFGSLDEITECIALMQVNEIERRPMILQDRNFWLPAITWTKQVLKNEYKVINDEDMAFIHLTDNVERTLAVIGS